MRLVRLFVVLSLGLFLAGPVTAKDTQQDLLRDFFHGPLKAEGRFKSRLDGSERPFRVKMFASWNRSRTTLTLVEDFFFQDGERGRKTWVFKQVANGRYKGTREDVIGEADVWQDGDILRLAYKAHIRGSDGTVTEVRFEDELVRTSRKEVKNTATVHWWFLTVGDVALTIIK